MSPLNLDEMLAVMISFFIQMIHFVLYQLECEELIAGDRHACPPVIGDPIITAYIYVLSLHQHPTIFVHVCVFRMQ